MNNDQFRKLVLDQTGVAKRMQDAPGEPVVKSKKTASFRTTEKHGEDDYAHQLRGRKAASQPSKKFKSFTPRGVKLGTGYIDRARAREDGDADKGSEKEEKVRALEKQLKLGAITQARFEALRDEITAGDLSSTYLVKGLDRRLLEKVRNGEVGTGQQYEDEVGEAILDAEDELDKLGEREVHAVKRDKLEKKGNMAMAGRKRTRDEILAELKREREAAREANRVAAPKLDASKWARVDGTGAGQIQTDHKGRQVITVVDEHGKSKKKVRKLTSDLAPQNSSGHLPGMSSVSEFKSSAVQARSPEKVAESDIDDDDDIFAGVGAAYDPLGPSSEDDGEEGEKAEFENEGNGGPSVSHGAIDTRASSLSRQRPHGSDDSRVSAEVESDDDETKAERVTGFEARDAMADSRFPVRNYFSNRDEVDRKETGQDRLAGIQSILQKAARLDQARAKDNSNAKAGTNGQDAKARRRADMLANRDRDLDDMDLGFGGSRNDDEDEANGEDSNVRLSEWKANSMGEDQDDDTKVKSGTNSGDKKKRRPKKRKGDVNNVADIMRVIEGRKSAG